MGPARLFTVVAAATAGLGVGGWAAACGAFSLNDVVPAAPADARDVVSDTSSPCDASDPCSCLKTPTVISPGKGAAQALTVDSTYAYWLASTGGNPTAYRAPLVPDSGAVVALQTGLSLGTSSDFALLDPYLYVDIGNYMAYLARLPLDGGPTQRMTINFPTGGHGLPYDLRAAPSGLYWTNSDSPLCFAGLDGSIASGDASCGGTPLSPAVTPEAGSYGNHVTVGSSDLYWSVALNGEVLRMAIDGGQVDVIVAPGGRQERLVATIDSQVFWTAYAGDAGLSIIRAAADGSDAGPVLTGALVTFTVDETSVYAIVNAPTTRQIVTVSQGGGPVTVLACDTESPAYLAVDAVNVYWANQGDGFVKSVPK